MQRILKTVEQGAATQCYVATHPSLKGVSGEYFSDCASLEPLAAALDDTAADALWTWTESVT
jgi:WW domain-containing oxidoreductase